MSKSKKFLFNLFPKLYFDDHSCQISDLSHVETEIAICKISIMMLWDHADPYIQSTTILCDR